MHLRTVSRIPSLEPVIDAIKDAIDELFDDAYSQVADLSGDDNSEISLEKPVVVRPMLAGYDFPSDWPALLIGVSNIVRQAAGTDALVGGTWRGELQFHVWLNDDDPDRLMRSLERYAAVLWLILVSIDDQGGLGKAQLCPETFAIAPYPDPGQSISQQAIVLRVQVSVTA